MALSTLGYKETISGKIIDTAVKANKNLPPTSFTGDKVWKAVLTEVYKDFDNKLTSDIRNYIMTATVEWQTIAGVGIKTPVLPGPLVTTISAKATPSSFSIDSSITGNLKNRPNTKASLSSMGYEVWWEVFDQIGKDLLQIYPAAINTALLSAIVIVPPGVLNPPAISTLSPTKAINIVPYIQSQLKSKLESDFNRGSWMPKAQELDSKIKGEVQNSSNEKSAMEQIGEKIWNNFLEVLIPYVDEKFEKHIKDFMTTPGINWWIPPGTVGNSPIGIPIPGGTMPGTTT